MEELDKLKKDWQKNADNYPRFSEKELYAMLHKKSSSVVKWILIISILEFALWLGISLLMGDNTSNKKLESLNIEYITIPMTVIGYAIIIYFFSRFYIYYRKITATDNVKNLMSNILNTRKAVNTYILINICWIIVSCIVIIIILFDKDETVKQALHQSEVDGTQVSFYVIYIIVTILSLAVLIGLMWLFYKLIYGLLLKKLHRNYNELKKIDF